MATKQKPVQRPAQRARGGYVAEAARDNPPPRDLPPAIGSRSGSPANPPKSQDGAKPQGNPSKMVLGESSSGSPSGSGAAASPAKAPSASGPASKPTPDRVAPTQVPVPQLGQAQWSRTFPDVRMPAIASIGSDALEKLQEGRRKSGEWIEDQMREQAKDKAIERGIDRLPLSEALKEETKWQVGLIQRYKELYDEKLADTKEFFLGWSRIARETVRCLGSTQIVCDRQEASLETVNNRYADRTSERWKPWLKQDFQNRVPVKDPREP